ncbi:MAG: caspase family protein, partial [Chloroflexi bacterium]|nr:caspase family protein [Chloroflexota bacterium]
MADDATFKPFYANSYALVIGVNTYQDPSFVPLGEAEDDAQRVAELLEAQPYNFKVRLILGEEAIQQNILQAMYDLRSTGPDDR